MKRFLLIMVALSSLIYANFNKSNGVVTDNKTGLQWQDDYSDENNVIKVATWQESISYCEALVLNNYDDWRLPNINELASIIDYTQQNPALHAVFENFTLRNYWSSTYEAGPAGLSTVISAWYINFSGSGSMNYQYMDQYFNNVRCVRAGW